MCYEDDELEPENEAMPDANLDVGGLAHVCFVTEVASHCIYYSLQRRAILRCIL